MDGKFRILNSHLHVFYRNSSTSKSYSTKGGGTRKKGSCRILTDIPEKDEIAKQYFEKQNKQAKSILKAKQQLAKRKIVSESSSESDVSELLSSSDTDVDMA